MSCPPNMLCIEYSHTIVFINFGLFIFILFIYQISTSFYRKFSIEKCKSKNKYFIKKIRN